MHHSTFIVSKFLVSHVAPSYQRSICLSRRKWADVLVQIQLARTTLVQIRKRERISLNKRIMSFMKRWQHYGTS